MGKQNGAKTRQSGQSSGHLPSYFPSSPPAASQAQSGHTSPDMAPTGEGSGASTTQLTKSDLMGLKEDLKLHLTALIDKKLDPVVEQISSLTATIKDVANTADAAYTESEKNGGLIKELKASERQLKERIAWLEQRARAMNLKVRGIPESSETNKDLQHTIVAWLTPLLKLDGTTTLTITSAYRVGSAASIRPNFPRDIILQFLYTRERDAVLAMARRAGSLSFSGAKVIVLLDLPQEVLQKRRCLKPITDQLKAKNIRFRWSAASEVIVFKDGAQYRAEDLASGNTLLAALDVPLPPS